jgi:hypothetical protein
MCGISVGKHWTTLVVLAAAAAMTAVLADNATTAMCLSLLGDRVAETNPFSNMLMAHWGLHLTMIANAVWAAVVIVYFCDRAIERTSKLSLAVLLTLALIRGFAAVNNYNLLRHVFE